ncbi:PKD domain-containing protein [Thiothrix subterranea]|uniref:PKD domain-containing protein n=1 Tax=Thiothrix subterranea TaxID=2735563 RepID=A0AA51MNW3_9GAMM|nr:PKD domain-containing protein [Thiothrix subterranea]MDQ5768516.1 PKD domain-containing protein [Thiothrix subterranea]WML87603.1 PKD domain-containing protein [Thiothrix subterranea]
MKTTHILPALVAGTLLSACGGTTTSTTTTGGTSTPIITDTGANTTPNTESNKLADASSVYTGSRALALLDTVNSMAFVNLVLGTENINDNITAPPGTAARSATASTAQANLLQSQRLLSALAAQQITAQGYQARGVNSSDTCPGGGTATVTGDVDDTTFTGTLQVLYNQCKSENVVTNGSAMLVIHAFNIAYRTPTSYTVSMKGLSVRVDDAPYTITGTLRTDLNLATGQSTLLMNQYQLNLGKGNQKQQLAEAVKMNVDSSGYTDITGKFCEGVQGCVTASTLKPLMFAADGVPLSGELALTGAASSNVQVIAQGYDTATPPQRKLQVNLDSNGDGVYESPSIRNESVLKNFPVNTNAAPTAVATLPIATTLGATLMLDGSKTTDPEGDFLTYHWTLEAAPTDSSAMLVAADSITASFTPDKQGTYTVSLKATDVLGNTHVTSSNLTVMAAANPLNGNTLDAAYSDALDQLITVSSQPRNALNIIHPNSGRQQTVALPFVPTSLAISPDGETAVVGHNGAITHVDLAHAEILDVHEDLGINVFDIALGNNGKAYATPPASLRWSYLYAIDLASGSVQEDGGTQRLFGGAHLQAVPSLKAVYTLDTAFAKNDLNRYDTSAAQPMWLHDSPYYGQHDVGGANSNLWSTDDGMYLLTAGGSLFQTAAQVEADMHYQRSVADDDGKPATYLLHADHSQKAAKFVAIETAADSYRLKTYTTPLLNLDNSLALQGLSIDGSSAMVKPSFVFFNAEGTERYSVLEQAGKSYVMAF